MNRTSTHDFRHKATVKNANRLFLNHVRPLKRIETVRLEDSVGRILARSVRAKTHLPAFDVSIVDGFAARATDLRSASSRKPIVLQLIGESTLGEIPRLRVREGQTAAVATGSIVPRGCDAVVMVEDVRALPTNEIEFRNPAHLWQGITKKGQDISPGRVILNNGSRLRPEDVGALKALGLTSVQVVKKVRVGVLSTGNELVDSFARVHGGKITDLNRPVLLAMLRELGAVPIDLGIAKDDETAIMAALKKGLAKSDLVLVTAGSSVGRKDLVPECINGLGRPGMLVHGVAMRPAMPTGLAVVKSKPVVSLPGFPVSAMIAFRTFVRPLLAKLVGGADPPDLRINAVLKQEITGTPRHRTFVRVKVKKVGGRYVAAPLRAQRSSQLTSMVDANGIVSIPESVSKIKSGSQVSVTITGDLRG